jgi:hypothetical protein
VAIILSRGRRGENDDVDEPNHDHFTTIKYHVEHIYANKMFTKEKNTITIAPTHPLMSTCPRDRK